MNPTSRRRAKRCISAAVIFAAAALFPASVAAKEVATGNDAATPNDASWSAEAEIALATRQLWRGLAWGAHPVLQPSASLARYGLTASLFGSVTTMNEPVAAHRHLVAPAFTTWIPSLSYARDFGPITFEPRASFVVSKDDRRQTTWEIGGTAKLHLDESFAIVTEHDVDVGRSAGGAWIATLGASYERNDDDESFHASIDVAFANARWNDAYVGVGRWAVNHVEARVELRRWLTSLWFVAVAMRGSVLLPRTLRANVDEATLVVGETSFGFEL